MAHGWDVHRSFSAKRMDTGRESPQNLQKNLSAFCDSEAIIWEEPGHPPWATQSHAIFWGLASRASSGFQDRAMLRSYRAPPNFRCQRPIIPSSAGAFFVNKHGPPKMAESCFFQPENSLICRETGFQVFGVNCSSR